MAAEPPGRGGRVTVSPFWTPARFQVVTGGRWLVEPADPAAPITGVSIDTRTLTAGQAYVAIRGDRFDGHAFVDQALTRGASLAIVEREPDATSPGTRGSGPTLLVDSTLAAMQNLARAYRDELRDGGCAVIAITGSNGKTTTRDLVHHVLSRKRRGTQSPKSFNNHIGVPYTLLLAKDDDDFIVVEIGSNHPGEVAELAAIVRPDAAVVTCIGHEHLEFFGTLEGVAEEEFSVLRYVDPEGLAVVPTPAWLPAEPTVLAHLPQTMRLVRFEHDPAVPPAGAYPLLGEHNRRNAAAAAAVARWMGLADADIEAALRTVAPVEGRMQELRVGDTLTILHDAYNANPSSMRESVTTLAGFDTGGRRIAVLSDMLELGDQAPALHRATAEAIHELEDAGRRIDRVFTIGPLSMFTAEALLRRWGGDRVTAFPEWTDELPATAAAALEPGDVVLLKGSRGMRLERLIPAIRARFAPESESRPSE